jgi:probable rRNA maturation factor
MSAHISGPPDSLDSGRLDTALLKRRAQKILGQVGCRDAELSIALVDDAEIRELNRGYRAMDRATDVLSFSLVEGECADFRSALLGDVVISIETARRQARARHRSLDEEVARLLIHGVLHILGHDHEETEEWRRMRAEERRLSAVLHR